MANSKPKTIIQNPNAKELTSTHKRAAHMIVMGATVNMVAQELGMTPARIEYWTWQERFIFYMSKIEKKFMEQLEKQSLQLRRAAFRVLQEKLTSTDPFEQRWAVDKILHATEDKVFKLSIENSRVDERPALSAEAKAGAKAYLAEAKASEANYFNTKPSEMN